MVKKKNYNDWSKEELIKEVEALKKQKTYGLVWEKDKTKEVFDYYLNWDGIKTKEKFPEAEHKFPILKEIKKKDITTDQNEDYNVLIEGDNYHSLATLNFTHNKKISAIYIDPPYNTGNDDFWYNDDYVEKEDGYRHSKWLTFMEKRLILARNLLRDDGSILISIDDNEQAQLKLLCDEIFGENNFVTKFIVTSAPAGTQSSTDVALQHSYCLLYRKTKKFRANIIELNQEEILKRYNKEDPRGKYYVERLWKRGVGGKKEDVPTLHFPIYYDKKSDLIYFDDDEIKEKEIKNLIKIIPYQTKNVLGRWTWSKKKMKNEREDLCVIRVAGEYKLHKKVYLKEGVGKKAYSIIDSKIGRTELGSLELKEILNKKSFFYPKPSVLIEYLLSITSDKNSIILDFFAGTGTTGHSVLKLNKKDEGNRRFILCTNNESKICTEICLPRLKNVMKGYKNSKGEEVNGLGGNLKYFKTDFVDSSPTDKNKKKIVEKSTEMICLKENTFEKVSEKKGFKIFKNNKNYLGIIFDDESIDSFIKEAKKIDGEINVYVFSLDNSVPDYEFKELRNKIKLCPIPEAILHIYRRIFK